MTKIFAHMFLLFFSPHNFSLFGWFNLSGVKFQQFNFSALAWDSPFGIQCLEPKRRQIIQALEYHGILFGSPCRASDDKKSYTVHLQLYICWKITIMGTSCHKWEGLANIVPRHWQCYWSTEFVTWPKTQFTSINQSINFSDQLIDYMVIATKRVAWDHKVWWHLQIKLSKKRHKKLSPLVVVTRQHYFEGHPLAVVVLPPLCLGSPMVHVCIHGRSVPRVNLGGNM